MSRKISLAAAAMLAVALIALIQPSPSEGAPEAAAEFDGKTLLIYTKGRSAEHAYVLEKARIMQVGGVAMLTGVHIDTGEAMWMRNCEISIAWDAVESIVYFEDVDAYKRMMADFSDAST